jgi:hypothetical protein
MWERPWRWLVAIIAAAITLGLVNQIAIGLGTSQYLGLPNVVRAIVFGVFAVLIDLVALPRDESMRPTNSLPPLPEARARQPQAREQQRSH